MIIQLNKFPQMLGQIFDHLLTIELGSHISPHDMIRIVITAEQLNTPIALPLMRRRDITVDRIMVETEKVLQSHRELYLDGGLRLNLVHLKVPSGGGRSNRCKFTGRQSIDDFFRGKTMHYPHSSG